MGDTPNSQTTEHDLRAVTPRLADLQRKCRSVGSRNDEAGEMETRIESILQRLQSQDNAEAEPLSYAALARELYAVERFFESNGFLSIAKEVAHVERTLESFASPDEPEAAAAEEMTSDSALPADSDIVVDDGEVESLEGPSRWAVPKPLAAVVVIFLVAIAVCVVLIVQHERPSQYTVGQTAPSPPSAPTTPPPTLTPVPGSRLTGPSPGAILAGAVGQARLALAEGDVETAIDHLSQAALIDSDHATVLGTARQIVDLLVDRADIAADGGMWNIADLTLARANRIAGRFGLDTHRIEQAAHRHSRMERFILIQPGDTEAIRAASGKRVSVFLKDGSQQESVIKGTEGGHLLLDEDTPVRGGAMYYVEKVPLRDIDFLKVWEK